MRQPDANFADDLVDLAQRFNDVAVDFRIAARCRLPFIAFFFNARKRSRACVNRRKNLFRKVSELVETELKRKFK